MPRKQETEQAQPKRSRTPRAYRNDETTTAPIVMNAARVLSTAMDYRGLSPAGLNEAIRANTGAGQSPETIRQKMKAIIPLSLVNLEEYGRALGIPARLFLEPVSETLRYFAKEAADLEAGRDDLVFGARDLRFGMSTWNTRTPACDPETDALEDRVLVSIGS